MKRILLLLTVLLFAAWIMCGVKTVAAVGNPSAQAFAATQAKSKTPVLVELFTSEGCATCPPAERNLAILEKEQPNPDAEIITLALHVDYWNRLGWTDAYSSPIFSQRQQIYGSKFKINQIYTPQMIVDGSRHFVGSNMSEAQKIIGEAAKTPKANVELTLSDDKLKVKITDAPKHEMASVYLAIAEDNILTDVRKGENGGRVLQHTSVVRELKPLGRLPAEENQFEIETVMQANPNWKRENLKAIVFIQENQSRRIFGVVRKTL
jgi:hypothetical protein